MKTSTEIQSIAAHVGQEKAIELVARAGFDAWDFSLFEMARYDWKNKTVRHTDHPLQSPSYADYARRLRRIGEECGIHCNQSHAPFPVCNAEIRSSLKRAIECTAIAGGRICIIHPDNDRSPSENAEMYLELLPFAKEHGVKIATENMWNWSHHEDFLAHIQAVDDPYLVACLDIGHAEMQGLGTDAEQMILTLGKHLQALHLHDNDRRHDSHQIPFSGEINFDTVVRALKRIGYDGYFTLEADRHLSTFDPDTAFEGVRELHAAAKRLCAMFDEA